MAPAHLAVGSTMSKNRSFSFSSIPKIVGKTVKLPAYLGGGLAAAGSYIAYKVEEASNYTQDKLGQIKDIGSSAMDKVSGFVNGLGFGEGGNSSGGGGGGGGDSTAALGTAAAIAAHLDEEADEPKEELIDQEDDEQEEDDTTDDQMMNLTRQMIEIRSLLQEIDRSSDTLKLPSIVVIGSQSSGKSSVLEAIVGQEFLPKGSNMVTRRPIELTLVNTPNTAAETADFPALKMYNLTDFTEVQKILFDLNMAVPENEAISKDPIQLTIRSPTIPDLSLVDLPGYIQVEAADQPPVLKQKIRELCDKYLESPNVILAISSADVDLANSAALRASKLADPKGERTIGVITKLDLVEPKVAKDVLLNKKYPLKMGYVGVITKAPTKSLFRKASGHDAFVAQQNFEYQYLKTNKPEFSECNVSTRTLKKKLIKVLEKTMSMSLAPTAQLVQQELDETAYKFKVEFNDRQLTPKTYLAENVDALKLAVKEFKEHFGRVELKSILRNELDQKVLDLLSARYWNKPNDKIPEAQLLISNLQELNDMKKEDPYWSKKLDLATSSLTKLGVGRFSTSLITNAIISEIENIVDQTQLRNHPLAKEAVREAAETVLNSRYGSTADQVENCIKPYKYEVDVDEREWAVSREHTIHLIKQELQQCQDAYHALKNAIGGRKLSQVITYIEDGGKTTEETVGFSQVLLKRGQEAMFLRDRSTILNLRLKALKSTACKMKDNKFKCPEIFLNVVNEKLTTTAVLFLNVELLTDFFYKFPRELDSRLNQNLNEEQIEQFAKEDPKIKRHIELQQRKELLELVLQKIDGILAFQRSKTAMTSRVR
jgi:replication fork clamp-binding protein CrfC